MKRLIISVLIVVVATYLAVVLTARAQVFGDTIGQLEQWRATSTPVAGITQNVYGKPIVISGVSTGSCLTLDSNHQLTTTTCGSVGGSSGLATTSPWTALNLAQVVDNGHVTSIATSSLGIALSDTIGTLAINRGGTNNTSFSTNGVAYYDGTKLTNGSNLSFDGTNLTVAGTTTSPVISGSTSAGGNLTLVSTSDTTKGLIYFGAAGTSYYDAANQYFHINSDGIGAAPNDTSGVWLQNSTAAATGAQQRGDRSGAAPPRTILRRAKLNVYDERVSALWAHFPQAPKP